MSDTKKALTDAEAMLREKFLSEGKEANRPLPSDALTPQPVRIDSLALPDNMRPNMPFTKDKYLVRENPEYVAWERELRKFLRRLSYAHEHRINATMVYEWVTGLDVAELVRNNSNPAREMRWLNKLLRAYFGKPYMTYIMGRKVKNAYRVPLGYKIRYHRPQTLTLYYEYVNKQLNP